MSFSAPLVTTLKGFGTLALDALLPPRCVVCYAAVEQPGALCGSCWEQIDFLAPPLCATCGFPFAFDVGPGTLCGACARETPVFDRARAVLTYNQASRALLLRFKHGDRTEGAPAFARWMLRAGAELIEEADLVVPVPLHRLRLFRRRYNQSALLAQAIARAAELTFAPDLLVRKRNTPPQGRLSPAARRSNVAGAFAIRPGGDAALGGRRVLLIDDVFTSGATVEACSSLLKRNGAATVQVLVLARVVRHEA